MDIISARALELTKILGHGAARKHINMWFHIELFTCGVYDREIPKLVWGQNNGFKGIFKP